MCGISALHITGQCLQSYNNYTWVAAFILCTGSQPSKKSDSPLPVISRAFVTAHVPFPRLVDASV